MLSLLRQNMDYMLVLQWIFLVAYCSHISIPITPVPDYLHRSMPLCCSCYVNERIRDRGSRADLQVSPSLGPAHTPLLLGLGGSLYIYLALVGLEARICLKQGHKNSDTNNPWYFYGYDSKYLQHQLEENNNKKFSKVQLFNIYFMKYIFKYFQNYF